MFGLAWFTHCQGHHHLKLRCYVTGELHHDGKRPDSGFLTKEAQSKEMKQIDRNVFVGLTQVTHTASILS